MNKRLIGLAAGAALLALLPGALQAAAPELRESMTPAAQKRADRLLADAREALARGAPAAAVRQAEAAVAIRPLDAQARALLGRAYLAAGRFQSAETALGDALTLDPSLGRAAVGRALAQIALGKPDAARATLDAAPDSGADADIGLAFALMGDLDRARETLLAAAREPGADARTRQNLALAYALEGRWNDAATIAAQDVPAELVADRLRRWAMVAQLRNDPAMQVGTLLGALPAVDGGLPAELALALPIPEKLPAEPLMLAQAAPFELVPSLPFVVPAVQVEAKAVVTQTNLAPPSLTQLVSAPAAASVAETAAPPVLAMAEPSEPVAWAGPPRMRKARIVEVKPPKPASRPVVAVRALRIESRMTAPKPALLVARTTLRPLPAAARGWSVQLGAFSSAGRTEVAWSKLNARVSFLSGHVPTGSKVRRGKALFHRLSIGGLPSRADAVSLCLKVREAGGACFVRRSSGDQPLTWALRAKAGEPV
ncbi:SPOR domain-containing protein [Rhizorhabdus dicambivorans]|nr:SPOR domain-containing protein [Rhizorhabdus dicambivorans]